MAQARVAGSRACRDVAVDGRSDGLNNGDLAGRIGDARELLKRAHPLPPMDNSRAT